MHSGFRALLVGTCANLALFVSGGLLSVASASDRPLDFARDIKPLLSEHCFKCHGPDKQKGGLRLDDPASALTGGDSGEPAIVPGTADKSPMFQRIVSSDDGQRMPPEGPRLSEAQITLLRRWIDSGALRGDDQPMPTGRNKSEMVVTDADRLHWSFRPLAAVEPPSISDPSWVRTPVDRFILHALEANDLRPTPPLSTQRLVRRMYFDGIGLPPIFLAEGAGLREQLLQVDLGQPNAPPDREWVEALVDKLLASPHYGERWARHWLDVARFADSDGQESDGDRPNAYRFRDFLIRAFNDDLPYDTFVRWQLAGDEIQPDNPMAIAATGFIVAGNSTILNVPMEEEKLRNRANELDDMLSTTCQAFLGLTLACARCHDHKYDPLPTRDYYRMMCAFNGGDRTDVPLVDPEVARQHRDAMGAWQEQMNAAERKRDSWLEPARQEIEPDVLAAKIADLPISKEEMFLLMEDPRDTHAKELSLRFKKQLAISDSEIVAALSPDQQKQWRKLAAEVQEVARRKPAALPAAFAFADFGPEPRETWFFERGDFLARNERMQLGFLTVLTGGKSPDDYWQAARRDKRRDDSTQQRRAMAQWITDVEQGAGALLARVIVNRVWQHHFGEGLVRTVSDFGTRGERPSHPELLEWLSAEFIRSGWSLKHLHRLILNSAAYQQGVVFNASCAAVDPENRLLWRRRPRRLEAEALRDAMLLVAGSLNPAMHGPSFKPPIAPEAMQARNVKQPYPRDAQDTPETRRRSIYMFHKRVVQYPLMQAFDAPDAQVSCGRRVNTTVAPQALALLNDPFIRLRASDMTARLRQEAGDQVDSQIARALELAFSRAGTTAELSEAQAFVSAQTDSRCERDPQLSRERSQRLAITDLCQMLFASNEFIYVD